MNETIRLTETIEQEREMISDWVGKIGEHQRVDEMPINILRDVLTSCGADFENLDDEAKKSLSEYSEKDRGFGVRKVWGDEFVNDYKRKVGDFIKEYELETGIELPELVNKKNPDESTKRKNSGMIQFLFDLTSFASGEYNFETYKLITETRVKNGKAWAEGRKEDRIRANTPNSDKPLLISSIPTEFPNKAWVWISSKGK